MSDSRRLPEAPDYATPVRPTQPGRPTEPGILEALTFALERTEYARQSVEGDLIAAVNTLEQRLDVVLKLAPPMAPTMPPGDPAPHRGPASGTSSQVAQQANGIGCTADDTVTRVQGVAARLLELADRVDLS